MSFNKPRDSKNELPSVKISDFTKLRPWVLVPKGSFMGFFDWVPEHLRLGPWSPLAPLVLMILVISLIWTRPVSYLGSSFDENKDIYLRVSSYPEAFSTQWYISLSAFFIMSSIFTYICVFRTPGVIVTYTIQSWIMNLTRHGVNMAAPFLVDGHILLRINKMLRLPALITATVTYTVWNFVLVPFLCFHLKTKTKRKDFLLWNFSFRLVQLHGCNMVYAIMNTVMIGSNEKVPAFEFDDLWYALVTGTSYGLLYILILDRLGLHLYPLFSPRSRYSGIAWLMLIVFYTSIYWGWNQVIELTMFPSLVVLCASNVFLTLAGWAVVKMLQIIL